MVAFAVLALVAAACGNDDGGGGGPSIDSFDVPDSADCSGGPMGTVTVSWETTDATEVAILVDGDQVASGSDPSGTDTVDVPCDGEDHDVELEASDGDGKSTSQTESVSTESSGGGGGGTTATGGGGTTTTTGGTTTTGPTTTTSPPPTPPTAQPTPSQGPAAP